MRLLAQFLGAPSRHRPAFQTSTHSGSRGTVFAFDRSLPATSASVRSGRAWAAAALAFAAFVSLWQLGALPLSQPDEGRNAEVAREMNESGAWLVPTLNGFPYLDKPAFYFRVVGFSLATFGDSEAAARLPSALFALGLLGILLACCRRAYGARVGSIAVVVTATIPLFAAFARTVIFDMALAFFTCGAILAGYYAEAVEGAARRRWLLAGAAAAGVATLVKGPVGFLVPTLVLTAWHAVEGRRDAIRRLFAPRNLLVFLAVVLPWFLGVSYRHPDFPYYGLVEESLQRYTTTTFHRQPFYFYGFVLAVFFLPWSLLFPESGLLAWRLRARLQRLDRLCVVWVLVVVAFFSLSRSKLPHYILSVVFPLGALIARLFDSALRHGPQSAGARIVQHVGLLVTAMAAAGGAVLAALAARPSLLLAVERRWPVLGDPALPTPAVLAVALAVIAALAAASVGWREPRLALTGLLAIPLSALALGTRAGVEMAEPHSSRTLAQRISALGPEVEVACLACYPTALPFYLGHPITVITRHGLELASNYLTFSLARGMPWPDTLVRRDDLAGWLERKDHPVLLLARERSSEKLDAAVDAPDANVEQYPGRMVGILLQPGGER